MKKDTQDHQKIEQPLTPEDIAPEEKQIQQEKHAEPGNDAAINVGDRIDDSKTLEEKAKQVAVNNPDIAGEQIVVPTYFVVDTPEGEKKALHHVKDAEEISDVIRQARVDENGDRIW
jgi:hypothetical protein